MTQVVPKRERYMKLNQITSTLINKHKRSSSTTISAAALLLMASSNIAAQEAPAASETAAADIEVIEVVQNLFWYTYITVIFA